VPIVVQLTKHWDDEAMPTHDQIDPSPRRCTAHSSRTGKPCKLPPITGSNVCRSHGGAAPQVKAKARQRLEDAADRMARELLKMAVDENVSDAVKLAAIRDALDRAGLSARTAVSVEVGRRPFEQIFDQMYSGSRAESRRRRGMPDDQLDESQPHALIGGGADSIVDAEVIEPGADCTETSPKSKAERSSGVGRRAYTIRDFDTSEVGSCRDVP
jgi:hypothetical protein